MSKQSGLGAGFFVDGYDLSGDTGSVQRIASPRGVTEVTGIDKRAFERLLTHKDGGIDWNAWFNDASLAAHPKLSTLPRTDVLVSYLHGSTLGNPAACLVGKQIDYAGTRNLDGSFPLSVSALANSYGLEWARQATAGKRTDTTATVGDAFDQGSASPGAFGLQMYVHVFAITGTSVTIKLQESSDNGADTYADVVGATTGAVLQASAPISYRIATGAINVERYLKVVTTGTFSNAVFWVGVVRNPETTRF